MNKYNFPPTAYKEILDKVHAGVYINQIDDVNDFSTASNIYINEYCIKMAGYSLEEFEAMGPGFFARIVRPEDMQGAFDSISFLCKNPEGAFSSLSRIVHKDGHDFWVYGTTKVFKMQKSIPWQFINVSIEIQDPIKTDLQLELLIKENAQLKSKMKCAMVSKREKEIIRLIVVGKTDRDIAASLNISPNTTRTHRKNILHKLGLANTADLVRFAVECGLY